MGGRDWRTWGSFLTSIAVLGVFLWLVGPRSVGAHLRRTDLSLFALGLGLTLVSLLAWSETQRTLLVASGAELSPWRGFVVYNVGMFLKQVLPMGHAGGPTLAAYTVGTELDRPYGENLGPVSIAEFQLLVASVCLAVVGFASLFVTTPPPDVFQAAVVGVAVVVAGLTALALFVWYRRRTVERSLLAVAWCLRVTVGRLSPRLRRWSTPESVRDGTERYYDTLAAVTSDRQRTMRAFGWALLGWFTFTLPLVVCAAAIGAEVSIAVALVVAPTAGIAGLAPLPGGIGSTELALTGLLVGLGGIPVATAAGVTLLYRFCTYWFVVLVGGLASMYQSVRPRTSIREVR